MCYGLGDLAPRGRNAQTLSERKRSSNRDACNRRGIRVIKFFSCQLRYSHTLHIGKPYSIDTSISPVEAVILEGVTR
jgi:hypothetical protein